MWNKNIVFEILTIKIKKIRLLLSHGTPTFSDFDNLEENVNDT